MEQLRKSNMVKKSLQKLPSRYEEIFQELVDTYIETGEAVGSRLLAKKSATSLSSASIRNIMADLEDMGLLYAPHVSSGRIPTEAGLRFFVDELLEISNLNDEDVAIDVESQLMEIPVQETQNLLEKATTLLSGLSKCVGLVSATKTDPLIQNINFVPLSSDQLLIVLVSKSGQVENRIITTSIPINLTVDQFQTLSNYLSVQLAGHTVAEGILLIEQELTLHKNEFDHLSKEILNKGIEVLRNDDYSGSLILRGHANLLEHVDEIDELSNIKTVFEAIETKQTMLQLLNSAVHANSIQIFIGSENPYFKASGCSLILSPYKNGQVVGAVGVIGPAHMKYRTIIPLVNYTSKILSKIFSKSSG